MVSLLRFWVVFLLRRRVVSLLRPGGGLFAPVLGGHFERFFQLGNALIRTTTAPTIIQGGIKDNVIPTKAEAVFNFRILPGETTDNVMDHIQKFVRDQRIKTT